MTTTYQQAANGDSIFDTDNGTQKDRYIISVWTPQIVRVQYRPGTNPLITPTWSIVDSNGNCPQEGWSRDALPQLQQVAATATEKADRVQINTGPLTLTVYTGDNPLQLAWSDGNGSLANDMPLLSYGSERGITHTLARYPDEHYYGFGESSGTLDKKFRRVRMRNTDALGYDAELGTPLYKHIPFYITLHGDRAYGLFYDTSFECKFDLGAEIDNYYGDYRIFRAAGGILDYYFIYGPTIAEVLERYTMLTGKPAMPPLWSLGYLGSNMDYADAPDAQEQLKHFVELCREHDILCSGFHLSSGYTLGDDNKRYVFTWNRSRFPEPSAMTNTFHEAGMQVLANIKPAMLTTHPRFKEAEALFIHDEKSDNPDLAQFWAGQGAHLDFTNPDTIAWWKDNVKHQLLDNGIDTAWNDNNEFNVRHDAARCNGFGHELPISAIRPVHTMLMVRASYEAQSEYWPDRRKWALTRAGAAGMQRYATTWSGDNFTSWKTLRYNIPMGLSLSLSGWPNMGHDVGGFTGDAPEPELIVRWVQNGIFHPRFSIHSWRGGGSGPVNAPWMYPEVLALIREALRFRYALLPYLYSLTWEAHQTGHPIVRPLVYHFQNDPQCHTESFDFMLGPSLLIASVLEPGATMRSVYLPRGAAWVDWHNGTHYEGGQTITLDAPLDRVPLLAREGAVIPMLVDGERQVRVFPHRGEGMGTFEWFEDDGVSNAFERGDYRITRLHVEADAQRIRVSAAGAVEPIKWVLPAGETRQLEIVQ